MSLDTEVYKEQDDNSGRRWKDTKIGRSLSGTEGDKVLLILIYITFLQHRPVHCSFWHVRQIISLHGQKKHAFDFTQMWSQKNHVRTSAWKRLRSWDTRVLLNSEKFLKRPTGV